MKKAILLLAVLGIFITGKANAQFDLSSLDKAISLVKGGNQVQAAGLLGNAVSGLTTELGSSTSALAPKILSQVGNLGAIIPALTSGTVNVGALQKVINTIKTLLGANRLQGLISGNKFIGNGASLLSNIGLLKSGLGNLSSNPAVGTITNTLDKLASKSDKLDKTGLFSGCAKKMVAKQLGSTLGTIGGLF